MSTDCSNAPYGALYLHVPFCVQRCRYCDFSTQAARRGDGLIHAYMDCLTNLVERVGSAGLLDAVVTAYVGGGTPTFAGAQLPVLGSAVHNACGPRLEEFSSEANPESLDQRLAAAMALAGFTRLSLGVQSLDDCELQRLGRAHTAQRALEACAAVVAEGLALSCDLMCGIPAQTAASWERSVQGVLDAGATHLSCYPLMIEEGTALAAAIEAGEEREPDDDLQADLMLAAQCMAQERGLARYEVASYARPGAACRHNSAYWTGIPYLGLGSAASSMMDRAGLHALADAVPLVLSDEASESIDPVDMGAFEERHPEAHRIRLRCTQGPRSFVDAWANGRPLHFEAEALTAREAMAEDLMLGLRMACGIAPALLEQAAQSGIPANRLAHTIKNVQSRGLARPTANGGLAPTEQGWLLGNELYGAFWDLASDDKAPWL